MVNGKLDLFKKLRVLVRNAQHKGVATLEALVEGLALLERVLTLQGELGSRKLVRQHDALPFGKDFSQLLQREWNCSAKLFKVSTEGDALNANDVEFN